MTAPTSATSANGTQVAGSTDSPFPTVNISKFDTNKDQISQELGQAARDIGFFYVTGETCRDAQAVYHVE